MIMTKRLTVYHFCR